MHSFVFQSTLSVRRATRPAGQAFIVHGISIHALRKESDVDGLDVAAFRTISIHALRKESDLVAHDRLLRAWISIHALRKESDSFFQHSVQGRSYFNPRSP